MNSSEAIDKVAKLKVGNKYTLVISSEMGFGVSATKIEVISVERTRYAQYDHAVKLVFKQFRKQKARQVYLYSAKDFAIYEGHVEIDTNPFTAPVKEGEVTVTKSKYLSCDPRYFTDAVASVQAEPVVVYQRN